MRFLALFITLATRQSAGRMRVWRALRAFGAATLRDGVYLLPDSPQHTATLAQVADDVKSVQGSAEIFLLDGRDESQCQQMVALFDRERRLRPPVEPDCYRAARRRKAATQLASEFSALSAIDFFPRRGPAPGGAALAELEARATGEPGNSRGRIRRLASADFQGRTWATRKQLWVDRMASAWLIQRFIDHKATFLWLDDPKYCPKTALGFDFDGASFTHSDHLVSFEVLAASFGLNNDPALARIAAIVHCLDVGGVPIAEAAGIEAVLAGARAAACDDDGLLAEASRLFDHLYKNYQQESHE